MLKKQTQYVKNLPSRREFPRSTILFYDQKIMQHQFIKSWIASFEYQIALNAGESLKTLNSYSNILNQIQEITSSSETGGKDLTFIAFGGGSVGDFVGFLASTYQRGKRLISIPTTWLAAIDSAHGGKNGLNLNGVKNQIGSFYLPEKIYICEKILKTLPPEALNDAFSEALKIGIINRSKDFIRLEKEASSLYRHLPSLINGKYEIVKKDPHEKKGFRKLLNLGHTMGHAFESLHGLSHGQAVFFGLLFALRFSLKKKYIRWNEFQFITEKLFLIEVGLTYQQAIQIPIEKIKSALIQDKKRTSQQKIDFIFVRGLGKVFLKTVTVDMLIAELLRQRQEL